MLHATQIPYVRLSHTLLSQSYHNFGGFSNIVRVSNNLSCDFIIFFYKLKNVIMCHMWRLTWQQNTKPCNNFFLLSYNIFESNPNLNALSIYMHLLWLLQIDISIEQRLRLWIVHTFVIIHAIMGVNGLDFFHLFKWFGFKIQTI